MTTSIKLFVLIIASLLAPVTAYFGVTSYTEYRAAAIYHSSLQQQRLELDAYRKRVRAYKQFAEQVEHFIATAQHAGVEDAGWDRHHIDIQERVFTFDELDKFMLDANGGDNYYFLPIRMEIRTPTTGSFKNPFLHSTRKQSKNGAVVSLKGDFLVRIK